MRDVIIIGGGLAGLASAIQLADAGMHVLVIEKKNYPFHRVCGEYISNEALPFLKSIGADPDQLEPSRIQRLMISSPSGKAMQMPLQMGGFGVSRYKLDNFLFTIAKEKGVEFLLNSTVSRAVYSEDHFEVTLNDGNIVNAFLVIGTFGKRSNLDRELNRSFFSKRSPYMAVKYHVRTDFPKDLIALHNFKDGYCGISKVEGEVYCLCYLTTRDNFRNAGSVRQLEESVLYKNPFLKNIFSNSDFLYKNPEVINEISFAPKSAVEDHILMSGDAAGMITPLCGNGMAMALHSSRVLCGLIAAHYQQGKTERGILETRYAGEWNKLFGTRLLIGRKVQQLFGRELLTDVTVGVLKNASPLSRWIIRQTHGKEF